MSDDRLDQLDYYTLIGVPPDADEATLRSGFRAFARKYHPDRFARSAHDKRERATEIYRRGAEGMQVLADPDARKLYDRALKQGILRLTAEQRDGAARAFERQRKPKAEAPAFASTKTKTLYERAVALLGTGDARGAYRILKSALQEEPRNRLLKKELRRAERILRGM